MEIQKESVFFNSEAECGEQMEALIRARFPEVAGYECNVTPAANPAQSVVWVFNFSNGEDVKQVSMPICPLRDGDGNIRGYSYSKGRKVHYEGPELGNSFRAVDLFGEADISLKHQEPLDPSAVALCNFVGHNAFNPFGLMDR